MRRGGRAAQTHLLMIVASECSPPDAIAGDSYGCVDCVVGYLRGVSVVDEALSRWRIRDAVRMRASEADEVVLAVHQRAWRVRSRPEQTEAR